MIRLVVTPNWRDKVLQFSGAGKVPILIDGSLSVHEALAIAEYAAERFPEARLWPDDPQLRARARAVSSEMSTSFLNVRNEMPLSNLWHSPAGPDFNLGRAHLGSHLGRAHLGSPPL